MTTNCVKNADNTYTVTVTVDGEKWAKAQKKALAKNKARVNLKGFRKNQVPDAVAKQTLLRTFGKDFLYYEAIDEFAGELLNQAIEENNLELIDKASLDIDSVNDESVTLKFVCPVAPEVKLGDYKNLGIVKDAVEVTDEDVNEVLETIANAKAEEVLVEDENATAANGNNVNIDFEGSIDGVPFAGGSAKGQSVVLGSNTFIPGFEEQIVGMKSGETKDITVTFPENYGNADLNGKEAVFKITLNDIYEKKVPAINDDLAKETAEYNGDTLDEMKASIKEQIESKKQEEADDKFFTEVMEKAAANAEVEVPAAMIATEINRMYDMQKAEMRQYGVDMDAFLKQTGMTEDRIKSSYKDQAESRVRNGLVLEAIADAENLTVSDEELDAQFKELAEMYHLEEDKVRNIINANDLRKDLRLQKASELLLDVQ